MSDNAWGDLLVVQLLRRASGAPTPEGPRRRRRREGWAARWWRGVVRAVRWQGARGRQTPEYKSFMASPEWAAQRRRVLRRDSYCCRDCVRGGRRVPAREVHHNWYAVPLAATPDFALDSLCESCHVRRHRDKRSAPTSRRLW